MFAMSSSNVRKDWSSVLDLVIRKKPVFIKRTRDRVVLCSTEMLAQLVDAFPIQATRFTESDGSITLSLDNLDIVSHGDTLQAAKEALAKDMIEYAEEYYQEFELYSRAPNRKEHLPYVMRALLAGSPEELEEAIECQDGKI